MPLKENDRVLQLLSWHGHDTGGVRVPFRNGGEPLGRVVETPLLRKLMTAARRVSAGQPSPRWIFLIGGPGNGKSQMIEEMIKALDSELGCDGHLIEAVRTEFAKTPVPRKVVIGSGGHAILPALFGERVGVLTIVQDASASDEADKDAAAELASDLHALIYTSDGIDPKPVFLCCANRGLLARAMRAAHQAEVVDLIETIIRSAGLGEAALSGKRPRCWPISIPRIEASFPHVAGAVACWPLDTESLLLDYSIAFSPVEQIIAHAIDENSWLRGPCEDCSSQDLCPFFRNVAWLNQEVQRKSLLGILRRSELASGQRWNFRAVFSLVAELTVGERDDFTADGKPVDHPCQWVHAKVQESSSKDHGVALSASLEMVGHLYPYALMGLTSEIAPASLQDLASNYQLPVTLALAAATDRPKSPAAAPIRRLLRTSLAPKMDPATWSPGDPKHVLTLLENAYAQSITLGADAWPDQTGMSRSEMRLFEQLAVAERECDELLMSRDSRKADEAIRFVRRIASALAKRSVGTRLGAHANERYLRDYEASIRDAARLASLHAWLRLLLGEQVFHFNSLESFGQPYGDDGGVLMLEADRMKIKQISPAPPPTDDLPAHDFPAITIGSHVIPLTFDLFTALQLRKDRCATGSLPASVRAALDRLRQLHAGAACRYELGFVEDGTKFVILGRGEIVVQSVGDKPRFVVPELP